MELAEKKCVPCEGGASPLTTAQAEKLAEQLDGWAHDEHTKSISKTFSFNDFAEALTFANAVGEIAEAEGHHPDLSISWGKAIVHLTTHAIGGLSENDFILAAKVDRIPSS